MVLYLKKIFLSKECHHFLLNLKSLSLKIPLTKVLLNFDLKN